MNDEPVDWSTREWVCNALRPDHWAAYHMYAERGENVAPGTPWTSRRTAAEVWAAYLAHRAQFDIGPPREPKEWGLEGHYRRQNIPEP